MTIPAIHFKSMLFPAPDAPVIGFEVDIKLKAAESLFYFYTQRHYFHLTELFMPFPVIIFAARTTIKAVMIITETHIPAAA